MKKIFLLVCTVLAFSTVSYATDSCKTASKKGALAEFNKEFPGRNRGVVKASKFQSDLNKSLYKVTIEVDSDNEDELVYWAYTQVEDNACVVTEITRQKYQRSNR